MKESMSREGSPAIPSPHLKAPGWYLTERELKELQGIANCVNLQLSRLFAINEDVEERAEAFRTQSRCNGHDGMSARSEEEAIAECLRLTGVPVSDPHSIQGGHSDSSGPRGYSLDSPIGSIATDLLSAQDKIERLIGVKHTTDQVKESDFLLSKI